MGGVGYQDNLSGTSSFTITRDTIIRLAFQNVKVLAPGESLTAEELDEGNTRLNLIIREIDESGKWYWTVQTAFHLPLQANVGVYDGNTGLPTNLAELKSVSYRSANGIDSEPLKILTPEGYESISNKMDTGETQAVYLTNDSILEQRKLFVWPITSTVTAQSTVLGTDNNSYRCIYPHTSSAVTQPTTGANWRMVWELGTGATTTWATNTAYTMAESLRIVARRPIFAMTEAEHVADFPAQFQRLLVDRLTQDLAQPYSLPTDEQAVIASRIQGTFIDIFASTKPKTNDIHNKTLYF